jgi:hypothetical protein
LIRTKRTAGNETNSAGERTNAEDAKEKIVSQRIQENGHSVNVSFANKRLL